MRKSIFQSESKIISTFGKFHSEVETFLIPEDYLKKLTKEERKALPQKIRFLIGLYSNHISSMRRLNSKAGKRKYQRKVGKLKRVNVRMQTGDWLLLGTLAEAHGVSRCYLVNFLLNLESSKTGVSPRKFSVGQPTPRVYSFIWQLEPTARRISRILRLERPGLAAPPT